jgi:hypothetical protein
VPGGKGPTGEIKANVLLTHLRERWIIWKGDGHVSKWCVAEESSSANVFSRWGLSSTDDL